MTDGLAGDGPIARIRAGGVLPVVEIPDGIDPVPATFAKVYALGTLGCDLSDAHFIWDLECLGEPHDEALSSAETVGDIARFVEEALSASP